MPTTRVMTTVLPYSVDPADPFHVSLFFSHRLDGGGSSRRLSRDARTGSLRCADATFRLRTDASATAIPCTPLLAPLQAKTAWQTAFPATRPCETIRSRR